MDNLSQQDEVADLVKQGMSLDFARYYIKNILPFVEEFEKNRRDALRKADKASKYTLIACVVATVLCYLFGVNNYIESQLGFLQLVLFATFCAVCTAYSFPVESYRKSVKSKIYPRIFAYFGGSFTYSSKGGISKKLLLKSGLIKLGKVAQEDYVLGKYKNVKIELSNGKITYKKVFDKDEKTLFYGLFIFLSMNKSFAGQTIISRDSPEIMNLFSFLDKDISKFSLSSKKLERVHLEDPVFEKKFDVYSTDQIEARYLVTPSFMERFLEMERIFGRNLVASFYDDKIFMMIPFPSRWFEKPSVDQKANFIRECNGIVQSMDQIFRIIEFLKLDQYTKI